MRQATTDAPERTVPQKNWAGNHTYHAARWHHPTSVDEVRGIVGRASQLRVVGSRHSFTDIGDAADLLSLDALPQAVTVDHDAATVTLPAGLTYAQLAVALRAEGVALHNLASLPHISVGGAIATATHGSGVAKGNLATAVAGLELVTSSGDVITARRGDPDFDGLVVGLGALGVVTQVTLDVEPAYAVRQRVFEGMSWDALVENLDAVMGGAESVSVFSRWGDEVEQVWRKSRVGDEAEDTPASLFGAPAATVERHPIIALDPVHATAQLGVPGSWDDRLPHFRAGFTPSNGEEIQSEYFVARADGPAAIRAMLAIGDEIRPLLQVGELRTIAADALWMSPHHGRDTLAFHFTWLREQERVERALLAVEAALAPFDARPHWGKLFHADPARVARQYVRRDDFLALAERLDPRGAFRNDWMRRHVLDGR